MDGRSPLEQFAAGIAKGTLDWTVETLRDFVERLKNRELAFIGRKDYIEEVKAQKRNPEWVFYKDYLQDAALRLFARLGLTLRAWEDESFRRNDIQALRKRIRDKYGDEGLHTTQVVQSRILLGVIPLAYNATAMHKQRAATIIEAFLRESISLCVFVQEMDPQGKVVAQVNAKLSSSRPPILVLFSKGRAMLNCNRIGKKVVDQNKGLYNYQLTEDHRNLIVTLLRADL